MPQILCCQFYYVQYILYIGIDSNNEFIMELRQLRYFIAVAQERHFGRAAQRLHMTQPPLSMQIRQLEEELGVALFIRNTRKVALTDAGRVFLRHAQSTLAGLSRGVQETQHAESGLAGRLEVGFISSATLSVLPPTLHEFNTRYPAVNLELKEVSSGHQIDALYDEIIRVGIVRLPIQATGIIVEPLLRESLIVALPENHALAACARLDLESIATQPLIFSHRQDMPGFHDHIRGLFERRNLTPNIRQRTLQLETIIGLVAGGVGISLLPSSSRHLRRDGVVYRPLIAEDSETWLGIIHRDAEHSLLLDHFKQILHETAKRLSAEGVL